LLLKYHSGGEETLWIWLD